MKVYPVSCSSISSALLHKILSMRRRMCLFKAALSFSCHKCHNGTNCLSSQDASHHIDRSDMSSVYCGEICSKRGWKGHPSRFVGGDTQLFDLVHFSAIFKCAQKRTRHLQDTLTGEGGDPKGKPGWAGQARGPTTSPLGRLRWHIDCNSQMISIYISVPRANDLLR